MNIVYLFLTNHIDKYWAVAICALLCSVVPYLLGSVNFALVISKLFYHDDIRKYGSGNAGMTNMLRTYGKLAGGSTLLCDMLKAVIAVLLGKLVFGYFGGYLAGLFCMLGHIFPIFFKFKGGKGVATVAAMILSIDPLCFLFLLIIFIGLVACTKYISLGSIICGMTYPILTYKIHSAPATETVANTFPTGIAVLFSFIIGAIIVFMHRENIKRLLNHTENKLSFSKKKKEK